MKKIEEAKLRREKRKTKIRSKITKGTDKKPRLSVFKSNKNFSAQVINDIKGFTLASISTLEKPLSLKKGLEDCKKLGQEFAKRLKDKKIDSIVFDRNGYKYHGLIANFANSLREAGIKF